MLDKVKIGAVVIAMSAAVGLPMSPAAALPPSSITGTAFHDDDRDGTLDAGELVRSGDTIYVSDAAGAYAGQATSGSDGSFTVSGLSPGTYLVQYAPTSWWALDDDWVPTTTGSIRPRLVVQVDGTARTDFGWRRIVRSTTTGQPLSSHTGSSGLRVESYNDAVTAQEVHDALARGTVGAEAPFVTVRLDLGPSAGTASAVAGSPGSYSDYSSLSTNTWATWLDGDWGVSHEYGHAWSNYYDTIVQQQGGFGSYLQVRGLTGDARLGTSHAWEPGELIAEDYRQLLGSPEAQVVDQENRELPPAKDVPGLLEYLRNGFPTAPTGSGPSGPAPAPSEPAAARVTGPVVDPAPVTKSATISSTVSADAAVSLVVRDAAGSLVRTVLTRRQVVAGAFSSRWDRKDAKGRRVPAGAYSAVAEATVGTTTVTASSTFTVR